MSDPRVMAPSHAETNTYREVCCCEFCVSHPFRTATTLASTQAARIVELEQECERLRRVGRDAAEILMLNGLAATSNALLESL